MQTLIAKMETLERYFEDDELEMKNGKLYYPFPTEEEKEDMEDDDILLTTIDHAADFLITPSGKCNMEAIKALQNLGYLVYPNEENEHGWLSGCIEKNGRVLVYA